MEWMVGCLRTIKTKRGGSVSHQTPQEPSVTRRKWRNTHAIDFFQPKGVCGTSKTQQVHDGPRAYITPDWAHPSGHTSRWGRCRSSANSCDGALVEPSQRRRSCEASLPLPVETGSTTPTPSSKVSCTYGKGGRKRDLVKLVINPADEVRSEITKEKQYRNHTLT